MKIPILGERGDANNLSSDGGKGFLTSLFPYFLISLPPYFLTSSSHDRQRNVTGPSIGCTIGAPVRRDSIRLAFSAKYHFAGRSASSISINRGLCFNPSACWIIVSSSWRRKILPNIRK